MSHEYAMSRVKDALEKSEGNHLKAQRLVLQWIEKDHTLLLGLVSPHLQSIITYAINHAALPPSHKREVLSKPTQPQQRTVSSRDAGEFGAAVLQSLKGGRQEGVSFGEAQARGTVSKPGQASQKHIDAIHKVRPMIPANLWPVASRTRLTLRQKIEQLVQKDGVRSDLARIVKCPVRELEGFMATNGMTDLWQRCEANLQKRLDAAQLARSQGWADKIISYLEQGYSLTDVAGFIPHLRGSYWDAAVALVPDQMLRTVSRRVKAVQVAQPRAPQRPVLLPSYLDVEGADRAALAETKGRHAALSAWAKARGLSPAQAQARWHRLPAALKEA